MELFADKTIHEQGVRNRAIDVVIKNVIAVEINADSAKKNMLEIKMVMCLFL